MKKISFSLLLMLLLVSCGGSKISAAIPPANGYANPIIPGFNPDPSLCVVGNDYYLATSSFEYFPAIPIYHSRDMVNWELISHAVSRPEQITFDDKMMCSKGIFAPSLRYNDGVFYLITTSVSAGGNFVVTTTDPYKSEWSEPHWLKDAPGIDPSLLFDDDGTVYYIGQEGRSKDSWKGHSVVWVQELDINTWQLVGERSILADNEDYRISGELDYKDVNKNGEVKFGAGYFEGPRMYKKDGYYYMLISHGGTVESHASSLWRSKSIRGGFEIDPNSPMITHRDLPDSYHLTSTGHADLAVDGNGDWWAVFLGKRTLKGEKTYIMGRETCISPVDWSGDWPIVNPDGVNGRCPDYMTPKYKGDWKADKFPERDEFEGSELRKEWTFIRTPLSNWWSVANGKLSIDLRPQAIDEQVNPSFIGIRQDSYTFTATTKVEFESELQNEEAGFVVERAMDSYMKFVIGYNGGKRCLSLSMFAPNTDGEVLVKRGTISSKDCYLRIDCKEGNYSFCYSSDGKKWKTLATKFGDMLDGGHHGRFTGSFVGLYASSNGTASSNKAIFDWFEYSRR